jgi:hypothetical protein
MQEILDGLLIGDSTLQHRGKNLGTSSFPRFGHNCKEQEFLKWIKDTLSSYGLVFGPTHQKPNGYGSGVTYQSYSHVSELLCHAFQRWYPNGTKVIPADLTITPKIANLWYCGDGGFDSDKGYLRQICLCAHSFPLAQREHLSKQLRKIGFRSRTDKAGKITISKKSIPDFLDWVGEPPVSCYLYKWDYLSFTSKQPKY